MTYGQPSGTSSFQPIYGDLILDAYERCQVYDLRAPHMFSARRSLNLRLQHWANRGINLFKVDAAPLIIDLIPGTSVYDLPSDTIAMLDTFRRTNVASVVVGSAGQSGSIIPFLVGQPVPQSTVVSTTAGSLFFNAKWIAHGRSVGDQVSFLWPIAVGGLVIGGVYNVVAVVDVNNLTFISTSAATSTSSVVVTDISGQDTLMTPISRNDYASYANKSSQGPPSVYWFERLIAPQVTVWPVPDTATAYQLQTYLVRQIQDANITGGDTSDLPQRFWYALVTDLAADLAHKYAPARQTALQAAADKAWLETAESDVEMVSTYFLPTMPSGL